MNAGDAAVEVTGGFSAAGDPGFDDRPGDEDQPRVEEEPGFDFPDPPRTGDLEVDQALQAIAGAMADTLEEQVAVYEIAHRTLQDRLADVEG